MSRLSHVGEDGRATMVDVTGKAATDRTATAEGWLKCAAETLAQVRAGTTPKGAVIQTAELAGVMAAKRTADLIPLCHPLPLTKAAVTIEMDGFAVLFHQASHGTVGLSTLQSRAFAGQIGDTFIFCLPGSTGACRDGWDLVLRDELDSRYRPCSLAGLVPRLRDLVAS